MNIAGIISDSIVDGPGLRTTVFFQGCAHKCKGCHNEWTWNYNQGKDFLDNSEEILNKLSEWLDKDYIDGITLSGGDPLDQDDYTLQILLGFINWFRKKYPSKTIWCYTGYIYENLKGLKKKVADSCDVLVDGPYKEELRDIAHTPFRGSTNQRIINIKNTI